MITLKIIDETNWRTPLKVREDQKKFVAASTVILARAYAFRNMRSRALLICDGETAVGMVLYYDCPDLAVYNFSELFIDERYQGRGYGKAAVKMVLDTMKQDGKYTRVDTCYIEGNDAAGKLYESFGFTEIDRDGDEIIMELCFGAE